MLLKKFTALLAFIVVAAGAARADDEAEAFVGQVLKEAEPFLAAPSQAERNAGIATLVNQYVDMRRVSRFALGRYARKITPEQTDIYDPLFSDYATGVYQNVLSEYAGETLEVTHSIDRSERDIIVFAKIANAPVGSDLGDVEVTWRVYRNREGGLAIVDAGANGVWLALEQRSTFETIIANNGGPPAGIDALIETMREQVSQ